MGELDVNHVARLLAEHALLLLGAGLVVVTIALATLVAVIRAAARHRTPILGVVAALSDHARRVPLLRHVVDRSAQLVPSAYVSLHLAVGLAVVLCAAAFVSVAHETLGDESEIAAFDLTFAQALHERTNPMGLQVFATISWLGSTGVLTTVTLVVAAVLLARGAVVLAVGWTGAQAGGALLNVMLKTTFMRARPEFADPLLAESSWSFPSGHAMGTFIACGVASYLVLRDRRSWRWVVPVLAIALSWSVVMAFSRLYLGVHFASDVIAGLVAGAAWVGVCVSAMEIVHRRRRA